MKKNSNGTIEIKKLCVDPQITSFDILQSLIAQAFSIKCDFALSYLNREKSKLLNVQQQQQQQNNCEEIHTSLWNDWDLDAAFMNSSEPYLSVLVEIKNSDDNTVFDEWDVISPVDLPKNYNIVNVDGGRSLIATWGNNAADKAVSIFQKMFNNISKSSSSRTKNHSKSSRIAINNNNNNGSNKSTLQRSFSAESSSPHMNLFNDYFDEYKWKQPLGDAEFRNFLDSDGRIIQSNELKQRIFEGGIDNKLRKILWRYLLNIYPNGLSGQQRTDYIKKLSEQYQRLKSMWYNKPHILNDDDIKLIVNTIQKDVLRTDRTIRFYSGDGNPNIKSLFNILLTYSLTHSSISYAQGMTDLLSPILYILRDEAQAYVCFCSLMKRLKSNFSIHSDTIELKIKLLQLLLKEYDPQLWEYLQNVGADHILFVYRWLLLECKREVAFNESLRMFEIMWSTLKTVDIDNEDELCLYEDDTSIHRNSGAKSTSTAETVDTSLTNANTTITTAASSNDKCEDLMSNKSCNEFVDESAVSTVNTTPDSVNIVNNCELCNGGSKFKIYKCKKTLEFNSDCKKKLRKSQRNYDTDEEDEREDEDDDDERENDDEDNELRSNRRLRHFPSQQKNHIGESDDDDDEQVQQTLVPETASKLFLNYARSHSDSNIDLIFKKNENKTSYEFNLLATPTKGEQQQQKLEADQKTTKPKRLDICFMFDKSNSDSKLNKSPGTSATSTNLMKTPPAVTPKKSSDESNKKKKSVCSSIITSTSCSCSNSLFNSYSGSYENQSSSSSSSSKSSIINKAQSVAESTAVATAAAAAANVIIQTASSTVTNGGSLKIHNPSIPTGDHHKTAKNIDSGYCSDVTNSPLIQTSEDLIYSLSKIDNPFLLFLCLTLFIENRDYIMNEQLDANDIACYFDKMIRKHNSKNVLNRARYLYTKLYLSKVNVFNYIQQLMHIQNSP